MRVVVVLGMVLGPPTVVDIRSTAVHRVTETLQGQRDRESKEWLICISVITESCRSKVSFSFGTHSAHLWFVIVVIVSPIIVHIV